MEGGPGGGYFKSTVGGVECVFTPRSYQRPDRPFDTSKQTLATPSTRRRTRVGLVKIDGGRSGRAN